MSGYDAVRMAVAVVWIVALIRFGLVAWRRWRWRGLVLTVGIWLVSGIVTSAVSIALDGLVGSRLAWDFGGPLTVAVGVTYWSTHLRRTSGGGRVGTSPTGDPQSGMVTIPRP